MNDREHSFAILDSSVRLRGPERWVAPIARAYRRFEVAESARPALDVRLDRAAGTIVAGDRSFPLLRGLDPTIQLYNRFLGAMLDRISNHAILHAAALDDGAGGAALIAAPSGSGKSSLALALLQRGYRLLGDDYAPLQPAAATISPYPRAISVHPGGAAPLPDVFLRAARRPDVPRILDKALVDAGEVLGESILVSEPLPVRHVILLAREPLSSGAPEATLVEVVALKAASERLHAAFAAIDGVEIEGPVSRHGASTWWLRVRHEREPTARLAELLEDPQVVFTQKFWLAPPDFESEPEFEPAGRREAATFLGKEMLNRRSGSRFLRGYGGDVTRMFIDLAGALSRSACWRVRAGRFGPTVDLIDRLVRSRGPGSPGI